MAGPADLAAELLARAVDDEAAARALLDVEWVTDAIVGFHAQQAVEKSLKAALAAREVEFPFSHDLARLVEICEGAALTLPADLDHADRLTTYAARLRHGTAAAGGVTRAEAAAFAAAAVEWAREAVGQAGRPSR